MKKWDLIYKTFWWSLRKSQEKRKLTSEESLPVLGNCTCYHFIASFQQIFEVDVIIPIMQMKIPRSDLEIYLGLFFKWLLWGRAGAQTQVFYVSVLPLQLFACLFSRIDLSCCPYQAVFLSQAYLFMVRLQHQNGGPHPLLSPQDPNRGWYRAGAHKYLNIWMNDWGITLGLCW